MISNQHRPLLLMRDEVLAVYLSDTVKGRQMKSDGAYVRRQPGRGKQPVNSQVWFIEKLRDPAGGSPVGRAAAPR
jgi:polyphosphate kinase